MLDVRKLKIGDTVIAIDNTNNENKLTLNKRYTISLISYDKNAHEYFVRLLETGTVCFFIYRFNFDLKIDRKQKLEKLKKI